MFKLLFKKAKNKAADHFADVSKTFDIEKRISLIVTFIFLFFGVSLSYSQPLMEIEGNSIYDWGRIDAKGKPLSAKVKIFNKGSDSLIIEAVKPDCGCTQVEIDKYNIEPGGFATLDIKLETNIEGKIIKSIIIRTNSLKAPTQRLVIKAELIHPLGLSSRFLNFGFLQINKETLATVNIRNNTKDKVKIKDIIVDNKDLRINLQKETELLPDGEFKLEAKYTPKDSTILSGKIILKTDSKEMEKVEILLWGRFEREK